jgi:calcium-dependent protein kinase
MLKHADKKILKNTLKLADFGLSTEAKKSSNLLFRRCGTPGFIAPEVINFNKETDTADLCHNCDIFSAGIIFHFMLTGKLPFDGETFKDILKSNEEGEIDWDIPELREIRGSALNLMKSMLIKDPNMRMTPSEALNHPYFYNYLKKDSNLETKKQGPLFGETKDTLNGAQEFLDEYSIGTETERLEKIDDLFECSSEIPEEQPNIAKNKFLNHLGDNGKFKLSPFIEARQLNKNRSEDTNDTMLSHKLNVIVRSATKKKSRFALKNNQSSEKKCYNKALF